jgi:hypothetical protein
MMMRKEKQEKKQASRVAWRSNVRREGKAGGRGRGTGCSCGLTGHRTAGRRLLPLLGRRLPHG